MSVEERITRFEFIRDIPYHIGLNSRDPTYNCATKCEMLAKLLSELGLKTRDIICTFDWTETSIPPEILALPRNPGETHMFLQVFIPETKSWINCDPTWNRPLKKAGFPFAKWDGLRDTRLAVKPHKIYTPEKSHSILNDESDPVAYAKHRRKQRAFYQALNAWLDEFK